MFDGNFLKGLSFTWECLRKKRFAEHFLKSEQSCSCCLLGIICLSKEEEVDVIL